MKVIFIDFTTCLQTIQDLKTRARGGMVSSLFLVPDALSQEDIDCAVWSDVQTGGTTPAGVRWYTVEEYDDVVRQSWDFAVFNRGIMNLIPELKARHRILWTHDLVHGGFAPDPRNLAALSATVFMSRYAEAIWRLYYPQIGKSFRIPNGVDKALFYPREKDLRYLIFISAPNRGLHRLGIIFQPLKAKVGNDLRMRAYSNMRILHPGDRQEKGDIPQEDCGEPFGSKWLSPAECGVEVVDPLPQPQIAEELGRAGLMILPSGYPEICSNAILQSLASGTPIVTTGHLGSAPEWVRAGWNGGLTETHLEDYAVYFLEIMRWVKEILTDERKHRKMIRNATATKGLYTWEEIGKLWKSMLKKIS